MKSHLSLATLLLAAGMASCITTAIAAVDEEAAMALLKSNGCLKCHDVTRTKKGPAYKKVAAKYKDKPRDEAKAKLLNNVTKEPMVELEDGSKEKHKVIDTKDPKQLDNLFEFILTR